MLLGRYEVLGQIGVGGFGRVLLARDPTCASGPGQLVAIKRLRRAKAQRKGSVEAIINEARIGSLLSHPNVVKVLELAHAGRDLLLVMEFINGLGVDEMLSQQRARGMAIPPAIALEITLQAASGLHYAHCAASPDGVPLHIVHRDIKPSNIMVGREGIVRLMDFGVARWAQPRVETTTGTIKGTLRYLSPEQAQGSREVGPLSDQFSLGLVLGEMLVGRPFYDDEKDHHVLLKALRGYVGPALEEAESRCPGIGTILRRCLATVPESRYPSVGALRADLEALQLAGDPELTLARWVHLGLEERARQAIEDPSGETEAGEEHPRTHSDPPPRRGRNVSDEVREGSSESKSSGPQNPELPLGWAHEQLMEFEETDEYALGSDEVLTGARSEGGVVVSPEAADAGWAMVQSEPDSGLDPRLLRRDPSSDEWRRTDRLRRPSRKVTDLSAEFATLPIESLSRLASGELKALLAPGEAVGRRSDPAPQATTAELLLALVPPPGTDPRDVDMVLEDEEGGESGSGLRETPAPRSSTAYAVKRPGGDRVRPHKRPIKLRFSPTSSEAHPLQTSQEQEADPDEAASSMVIEDETPDGLKLKLESAVRGDESPASVASLVIEDDDSLSPPLAIPESEGPGSIRSASAPAPAPAQKVPSPVLSAGIDRRDPAGSGTVSSLEISTLELEPGDIEPLSQSEETQLDALDPAMSGRRRIRHLLDRLVKPGSP